MYKKWFYILILPALIFFVCVIILPFLTGIVYSLPAWRGTYFAGNKGLFQSFVGFLNYSKAFQSKYFVDSLLYTFLVTVITVPSTTITAFFLALLVTKIQKGRALFRTIFYLPNMLGCLAMGFVLFLFIKLYLLRFYLDLMVSFTLRHCGI